ncbi:glutathione S-transferase family protein [Rhizorhabdus wittichii]|uniref:Glutathione S-transferase family protein n=2 Tax=Rhizorhabdus wittichii TaxID=160791 RepID=A0A975D7Z2_9SPHN|nr:glutathione S-transferase family protein [Rhizorhabdus wittichii]
MMAANITLYEIAVSGGASASPFVWRTKFSLARKGIPYRSKMLGLTDISRQFDGRFQTVPIIDFGDRQMNESIAIADWLDEAYPDLPAIFSGPAERAMIGFFDQWLLQLIVTGILPIYALDAHDGAAPHDRDYYRRSRESFFGQTLEEVVVKREELLPDVRRSFEPVRQTIVNQPFLGGTSPNFADMCLLGLFIFVGTIGTLPLLAADDPLVAYADRGFACFPSETASLRLKLGEPTR